MPTDVPVPVTLPGPVRDAETVLRIGVPAIEQRFGRTVFEKHQPYKAVLLHGEWLVLGNLDPDGHFAKLQEAADPHGLVSVRGGAPTAVVSPEDGRVLSVEHGR